VKITYYRNGEYPNMKSHRIEWVDTLRFLAIVAVLLGHYVQAAGRFYPMVFIYHVPLFFFISGFFCKSSELLDASANTLKPRASILWHRIKKNVKRTLLPYYFFIFLSLFLTVIQYNGASIDIVSEWFVNSLCGVRNTLVNGGAWFFPGLFSVVVLHDILLFITRKRYFVTLISIVLFCIEELAFDVPLHNRPSVFFNLDSALYYMLFYDLGELVFPKLVRILTPSTRPYMKRIQLFCLIVVSVPALYIVIDCFYNGYITLSIPYGTILVIQRAVNLVVIFAFFWVNIMIAKLLESITVLQRLGQNTMYICGNEHIVKLLFTETLAVLGLTEAFDHPLSCIVHISLMLLN